MSDPIVGCKRAALALQALPVELLLLAPPRPAQAQARAQPPPIGWQEAVARLAAERTRAETCVGLLKRHGDPARLSRGELAYGEAKAEVDAVVAALVVGLAEGREADSLPGLEARLARGVEARRAFCERVVALVPQAPGEKGLLTDLVGDVVGPVIEGLVELYKQAREDDRLRRKTIETQLEATRWPAFAQVAAP